MYIEWKERYQQIQRIGLFIAQWVGIFTAVGAVIGAFIAVFQWGSNSSFAKILSLFPREHSVTRVGSSPSTNKLVNTWICAILYRGNLGLKGIHAFIGDHKRIKNP